MIKSTFILALSVTVISCSNIKSDNSQYLSKKIVGEWEWEYGEDDCPGLESMAFKSNGTYTQTSEDCQLASDGFGNFYYGWYVANEYICFVNDERQFEENPPSRKELKAYFLSKVNEGYVAERCTWKINSISNGKIEIYNNGKVEDVFVMLRSNWL